VDSLPLGKLTQFCESTEHKNEICSFAQNKSSDELFTAETMGNKTNSEAQTTDKSK